MITLSVRQPWAWCIVNGHKPVENRDWPTQFRGPIQIHAGKTMSRRYYEEVGEDLVARGLVASLPAFEDLPRGGVVGITKIVDCVQDHPSGWFTGPFGFVLQDSRPLPFHPCNGALKFFDVRGVSV
ncbi:MAG: ASCH domain-containing protein [Hydrogenophaga sp.]|uniref:ASCH domain-containing protein n=1 Tax=Hydrogenophaga sp. TaxID=1904254 RepID=UPI002735ADE2|nr:ASCH domain-containing protein [Hydrogenophaga sp.]MDP3625045.1 ASCH domain-containing protein [Hydrogenophaga sp.]